MSNNNGSKPSGFIATCQCGVHVGAIDFERSERGEVSSLLGHWLMDGCTVTPQFGNFTVELGVCRCKLAALEAGDE